MPFRIRDRSTAEMQNCWEFKQCGRQPGGSKVAELGVCPAARFGAAHGFCQGHNGGRACAYITGTFCGGYIQGTHREKIKHCEKCDFYHHLREVHGADHCVVKFGAHVKAFSPASPGRRAASSRLAGVLKRRRTPSSPPPRSAQ